MPATATFPLSDAIAPAPRRMRRRMTGSEPDAGGTRPPLTELLRRAAAGEVGAADAALPLVYRELKALAEARMAGERRDHTLQATALVHETWLKLVGLGQQTWADRGSFYQAAATAMRRILVDHARRRMRHKRGGGARRDPMTLGGLAAPVVDVGCAATFLQLDEQIRRLEAEDPRAGEIVRLRFFAGLGVDETAASLGLSRRTVLREWSYAKARLFAALSDEPPTHA
jgi:RNA polymerase sigma factor (TIGR02999 family)